MQEQQEENWKRGVMLVFCTSSAFLLCLSLWQMDLVLVRLSPKREGRDE